MMVLKFRKQESSYDDRWQATNMVVPVNPHVLIQSTKEPSICYESQSTSYKYTAAWQRKRKKYNARTSAERSNKREKIDFKLESGRHRSTKMWYCRLYHIMMLQHLDAWDLPFESPLRKLILEVA